MKIQKIKKSEKLLDIFLLFSISCNLCLLGYYKYANFVIENICHFFHLNINLLTTNLPLGISFFTFTQISFLIDVRSGDCKEYNFFQYLLFVTYFPHLIAGPILHHQEMIPQFQKANKANLDLKKLSIGLTILILGLFKKVVIADGFAFYSDEIFSSYDNLTSKIGIITAWAGAFSYTLQLYFDFSAYSDMAIGISFMFGIKLPLNFNSPYKSKSIIDFWQRWHMTLSQFLMQYIYYPIIFSKTLKKLFYIPLNINLETIKYFSIFITMFLCGIWHGAGWTYLLFGVMHGSALVINHYWRYLKLNSRLKFNFKNFNFDFLNCFITFIFVTITFIVFRSKSIHHAKLFLLNLFDISSLFLPTDSLPSYNRLFIYLPLFLGFVWFSPNIQELFKDESVTIKKINSTKALYFFKFFNWRGNYIWAVFSACLFLIVVLNLLSMSPSPFLYFQF